MPRFGLTQTIALLLLALGLTACGTGGGTAEGGSAGGGSGGGERPMSGTWEVRIDPDRTIRLELDGSFDVSEDKTEADAGETDIVVETYGTITATNVSDGRNVDGIGTGLELFSPIETCPDWDDLDPQGTHCSRDLVSYDIPDLDVDESEEIEIDNVQTVTGVPSDQGPVVVESMLGEDGVVVAADRVFFNQFLEELNPTCQFAAADGNGTWVTYFSESEQVTACSTEARPG